MDTTHEKDIEAFQPLLPTRGRSHVGASHHQQQQQQSNGIVAIETTNHDNDNNNNDSTGTKGESVKISGSAWKAIMACFNYSFCSVSMILVNKSLASR
jgi:hypothetical protein